MVIKVKCIDDRFTKRQGKHKLQFGMVYNIIKFNNSNHGSDKIKNVWWISAEEIELKEVPGVYYKPRRFEIVSKEIVINLPDDLEKFPL